MIGIILIGDIKYSPYLHNYIQIFDELKTEYEVLFWNREGMTADYPDNYISFDLRSNTGRHPILKLKDFFKYKSWLKRRIKQNKYNKLVVLTTLSGIILADILLRKYKGRYIFDIRDYSYENIFIFYMIEKMLINYAFCTCISSEGFKEFLPHNYNYIIVHNFNENELAYNKKFIKKQKGECLNLVFIGGVRYYDHQVKIIDKLKNDSRFKMIYHGSGIEINKFIGYCQEHNIDNVTFTGAYDNKDKHKLLSNADIINNSYSSSKILETKYAISNKYYDGLIYSIPQLVEICTYKAKKVEINQIGISIDVNDINFAQKLYNYYFSIDEDKFNENCKKELDNVIRSIKEFTIRVECFIANE